MSKINLSELKLINELEDIGFRIMDSQVTYTYKLANFKTNCGNIFKNPVTVRSFIPEDLESVVAILEESFKNYGHYFADERLGKKECLDIYTDWGRRSCLDSSVADIVFVAEDQNRVAGMLSFKKYRKDDKVYAAGGLGAVSSFFRGRDVFKQIAVKGLEWGMENKFDWVEHNVLTTNFPVNGAFSSLGFKVSNSFITMHCWL
ncbi:MAG: hypothetical protein WCM76_00925 [Bacteroidota bacterium]